MPFYGGSVSGGMAQGEISAQQLAQMAQMMQQRKVLFDQQQQAYQRQLAARQAAGQTFYDQFAQPPAPGASSPGGTPNGGPPPQQPAQIPQPQPGPAAQAMQMGVNPGAQMQPPPAQPPQNPSWQPMPQQPPAQAGAGAPPGGPEQLSAPPQSGQPAKAAGASGVAEPKPFDLKSIIGTLKAQGVPPEKVMDMLDEMTPIMNAQNKQELNAYKVQNAALDAGMRAAAAVMQAEAAKSRATTGEKETERKTKADESKADLNATRKKVLERKLSGSGGAGAVKIVKWKEDEDGNTVGGFDRAGHFHKIDEDAPKTSPKAGVKAQRSLSNLKEDRRSLIARGLSPTDPKIKALDDEITAMERGGKKVTPAGGGDMQGKASAAWGKYEPEKYDYRINEQGVVQRKPKGQ